MVAQMKSSVVVRAPIALTLIALAVGCSESLNKVPVQGAVTFNGKKVVNGDIRFVPEAGTAGATASAPIVDGKFQVASKGGVPIGAHRVILRAFIVEGVGAAASGGNDDLLTMGRKPHVKPSMPVYRFEGREQFLPPEYNERAGLTINVTGEQNPQIEDFNLRDSRS
jgi:hypothetical protein